MLHSPCLFNRFVSWLVLVCFYFQTLWPSVVFATDTEVMHPVSSRPALGLSRYQNSLSKEEGRVSLGLFIDDKEDAFESVSPPLVAVPIGKSFSETQKFIDDSLSLQMYYSGLKALVDGFVWEYFGYFFWLQNCGNLIVSAKKESPIRSSSLRLYNPYGDITLSENLALNHLLARGKNIVQRGNNRIDRLDIWAMGEGKTPGAFINLNEEFLSVRELYLHKGQVENHGSLTILVGGIIDAFKQDCFNYGNLCLSACSKLVNGKLFHNLGFISGRDCSIAGKTLHNARTLEGEKVTLFAEEKLSNSALIKGALRTEIISFGDLENTGEILSDKHQTLIIHNGLVNAGSITASHQSLKVQGKSYNSGLIEGQEYLTLDLGEGVNSGDIFSEGDAEVTIREAFVNQKAMIAKGRYKLYLQGLFANELDARILGEKSFETLGEGDFNNFGSVTSTESLALRNKTLVNHNLLHSLGTFLFAVREKFTNKGPGNVIAEGLATIEGTATIENEAVSDPKAGIVLKGGVFFKDYQGELTNKGLFKSVTRVEGFLRKLRNSGVFKTEAGFESLTLPDFFNDTTGIMMGGGTVRLEGLNRGLWLADTLTLEITGEFSHGGGLFNMTDSLNTIGTGTFLVHSEVQSPSVSINTSHFENFSEWVQDQMTVWVGSKVTSWRNGNSKKGNKKAAMVVKELILPKSLLPGVVRVNEGTLKVGRFSNFALSFLNKGSMTLGQWAHQKHSFQN